MEKTQFLGITILGPTDSIYEDNAAFIDRDRVELDRAAQIGVKTHRHTGLPGLSNPTIAASAEVVASGGMIPSDLIVNLGYTIQDEQRGETELSPVVTISTPSPLSIPQIAPSAVVDYTAGNLLTNSFYYGITWLDGDGGETPLGPAVIAEREPGFANARVKLTQLTFGMKAANAKGWRLYRSIGGGLYGLLAEGNDKEDEFIDDGSVSPDCSAHPPGDTVNTTNQVSTLFVKLPKAIASGATFINLYGTITGDFTGAALLGQYPIASAGATIEFERLDFLDSSPPDVNRSYGGAPKIDSETEIIDMHWKRPVAASGALPTGELGDIRLVENSGLLYGVLAASAGKPTDWVVLGSGNYSLTASAASGSPGSITNVNKLTFVGSGGIGVTEVELTSREARITLTDGPPRLLLTASGSAVATQSVNQPELLELIGSAGINIKETESGTRKARVVIEGQAVVLSSEGMGVLICKTSEKGRARPTAHKQYTWFCKEKPTNMAEFDIWIEEGP